MTRSKPKSARVGVDDLMKQVNTTHRWLRKLMYPEALQELDLSRQYRRKGLSRIFYTGQQLKLHENLEFTMIMNDGKVRYRTEMGTLLLEQIRYDNVVRNREDLSELPGSRIQAFLFRYAAKRYLRVYQENVDEIWAMVYRDRVLR